MAFTEQQFEKAMRDTFLAHGKNLVLFQSRGAWMVTVDGGFDADGWECQNADKNTAMKKALQHFGYIQEVVTKLLQGGANA